jgi:hypothetical protein
MTDRKRSRIVRVIAGFLWSSLDACLMAVERMINFKDLNVNY